MHWEGALVEINSRRGCEGGGRKNGVGNLEGDEFGQEEIEERGGREQGQGE